MTSTAPRIREGENLLYDEMTDVYRVELDSNPPPDFSVILSQAISEIEDTDPTTLPPICGIIDFDGLNQLFSSVERTDDLRVQFTYGKYRVTITDDSRIYFRPLNSE